MRLTGTKKSRVYSMELKCTQPWPHHLPSGRLLEEKQRHMTLAFLGNISYLPLKESLNHFPKIAVKTGAVGYFDRCKPLLPKHSTVGAQLSRIWALNLPPEAICF